MRQEQKLEPAVGLRMNPPADGRQVRGRTLPDFSPGPVQKSASEAAMAAETVLSEGPVLSAETVLREAYPAESAAARGQSWPLRMTGEAVSIAAMALATLALGAALYLQFGLAPWAAAATSIAVYVCMLAVHAMMPRHAVIEAGDAGPDRDPGAAHSAGVSATASRPARSQARTPVQPPPSFTTRPDDVRSGHVSNVAPRPVEAGVAETAPPTRRGPDRPPAQTGSAFTADPGVHMGLGSGSSSSSGSGSRPFPGPASAPPPSQPRAEEPAATPASVASPRARPPREADVEMIQALIRKLADEVNSAGAAPPVDDAAGKALAERAIAQSVDALKTTAGSMRDQDDAARQRQATPPSPPGEAARATAAAAQVAAGAEVAASETGTSETGASETGRSPEVNRRLSALAEALALGRVEILLDPILDFAAGRPRHFEVSLRLRDGKGAVLDTGEHLNGLEGTGMLSRLDGARVAHASQIAMRFGKRADCLFSSVSGEALVANSFLDGVVEAYREREGFSGQLIMTFTQGDVRGFGKREWQALEDFATLGFRYAMADVIDLDMDFEALGRRGFTFAKLDADVFLRGLPAGNDIFVPASDICRHLASAGLGVIVGAMSDEQTAAKVFGFGVLFGQGALFGGPRALKRDVVCAGKTTQAA